MRTYTIDELNAAVKQSTSIRQTLIALNLNPKGGGAYRSIVKAFKIFSIDTSHFKGKGWNKGRPFVPKRSIEDYLLNKNAIQSCKLKNRLLKEGLLTSICVICNLTEWMNKPIPLELDHINGNHDDNSLINLRLLCPNCHAPNSNPCWKK